MYYLTTRLASTDNDDMFLVVASDGVWDTMSSDLVAKFVLVNTCKIIQKKLHVDKKLLRWIARQVSRYALLVLERHDLHHLSMKILTKCLLFAFASDLEASSVSLSAIHAVTSVTFALFVPALIIISPLIFIDCRENGSSDNISCIVAHLKSR